MFRRTIAPFLRLLAFLGLLASPLLLAALARAEDGAAPPGRRADGRAPRRSPVGRRLGSARRPRRPWRTGRGERPGDPRRALGRQAPRHVARLGRLRRPEGLGRRLGVLRPGRRRDEDGRPREERAPPPRLEGPAGSRVRVPRRGRSAGARERRGLGPPRPRGRAPRAGRAHVRGRPACRRLCSWRLCGASASSRRGTGGRSATTATRTGARSRSDPPADLAERVRLRLLTACGPVTGRPGRLRPEGGVPQGEGPRRVPRVLPVLVPAHRAAARARASPDAARRERRAHGRSRGVSGIPGCRPRVRLGSVRDGAGLLAPPRGGPPRGAPDEVAAETRRVGEARRLGERPARAVRPRRGRDAPRLVTRADGRDVDPALHRRRGRPREPRVRLHGPEDRMGRGAQLGPPPDAPPRPLARPRVRPRRGRRAGDPRLGRRPARPTPATRTATRRPSDSRRWLPPPRRVRGFHGRRPAHSEAPRPLRRGGVCGGPVFVDRPFSAPGVVDWTRLEKMTDRLSG